MLVVRRSPMRWILVGVSGLVVALGVARLGGAQQQLDRVSVDEALQLALRQSPTVRAQQAALASTKAGETTAALRPNPSMNFLAEQFKPGASQQDTQYTVNVVQPLVLGGKRGRRFDTGRAYTHVSIYEY